jgi:hypothetical protein
VLSQPINLNITLPSVFHKSTAPFEEFLAWLDTTPYLDKTKRKITYACERDYTVILAVLALLDCDISESFSAEEGELPMVYINSSLDHKHYNELHSAMNVMIKQMGYEIETKNTM